MKDKKNNRYKIVLQEIELKDGRAGSSLQFEFENHDDIFSLIEKTKNNGRFESEAENIEFMVGLKLFSEVMLRNRTNELFQDLAPGFREFMKKLKGK